MTIVRTGYAYILIGLVVLFLNADVHAATYKWIGVDGGLWSSTSSWKNTAKQSIIQNKKPNVVFIAIDDLNRVEGYSISISTNLIPVEDAYAYV